MILPFAGREARNKLTFAKEIDSVAVSGHKFLGVPMPCGVFMCRKERMDKLKREVRRGDAWGGLEVRKSMGKIGARRAGDKTVKHTLRPASSQAAFRCAKSHRCQARPCQQVDYIASLDDTISGSRSGINPIYLWYQLSQKGMQGYTQDVRHVLSMARKLKILVRVMCDVLHACSCASLQCSLGNHLPLCHSLPVLSCDLPCRPSYRFVKRVRAGPSRAAQV